MSEDHPLIGTRQRIAYGCARVATKSVAANLDLNHSEHEAIRPP